MITLPNIREVTCPALFTLLPFYLFTFHPVTAINTPMRIRIRTNTTRTSTGVKLYSSAARASFATIICAILRIFTPFLRRIRGAEGDKGLNREDMAGPQTRDPKVTGAIIPS